VVDIQELISRGRLILSGAPKRLSVFELTNGKRSTKEIARKARRSLSSVIQDLEKMEDLQLIEKRRDAKDNIIRKDGAVVYEKVPLIKHISLSYFRAVARTDLLVKKTPTKQQRGLKRASLHIPTEPEVLDICKHGEDQIYEFKAPGTDTDRITKEIAAFLHTKGGGVIIYGVQDDGTVMGSDVRRQDLDQRVQNSVRNTISPQPRIEIKQRNVMGSAVLLIIIAPWDRKTIYQYTKDLRYYIRKGTNVFALKPEEITSLSQGQYVI